MKVNDNIIFLKQDVSSKNKEDRADGDWTLLSNHNSPTSEASRNIAEDGATLYPTLPLLHPGNDKIISKIYFFNILRSAV